MFGFFRLLRLLVFAAIALAIAAWIANRAEAQTVIHALERSVS